MAMSIEFPFVEVTDVDIAFGGIPNYEEALAACPPEFYSDNEFSALAQKWFSEGLQPETDLAGFGIRVEAIEDAVQQRRYVEAWLGSFEPHHQDKIAVSGWLLSLMLVRQEDTANHA
jgi:hypothetical protein